MSTNETTMQDTARQVPGQPTAAMELDLMPYVSALIDARWIVVAGAVLAALLSGLWAFSKPYQFQSAVRVSVVDIEDPGKEKKSIKWE